MLAEGRKQRISASVMAVICIINLLIGFIALASGAIFVQFSGKRLHNSGALCVDASNASDGYVLVCREKCDSKLKLRISKDDITYTYDLNSSGEFEAFPLQMGSGCYHFSLYRNVQSNKYTRDGELDLDLVLSDENAPFLCPSQYVNYDQDSKVVQLSNELCAGMSSDKEKYEAISSYISKGFVYDYVRALTTEASYIGDIDRCIETRMGLCLDYASLVAAMFRCQGIPAQVVIGYANNYYHAWNNVCIDGEYRRLDPTAEMKGIAGKSAVYTAERIY